MIPSAWTPGNEGRCGCTAIEVPCGMDNGLQQQIQQTPRDWGFRPSSQFRDTLPLFSESPRRPRRPSVWHQSGFPSSINARSEASNLINSVIIKRGTGSFTYNLKLELDLFKFHAISAFGMTSEKLPPSVAQPNRLAKSCPVFGTSASKKKSR